MISDLFLKSEIENPFKDQQARNYSDDKIINEFQPTKNFWGLFNSSHQIIIGSRGSGKTALLRMMRYSCLRKMNHSEAARHINSNDYLAIYVPTSLEAMKTIKKLTNYEQVELFKFFFNVKMMQAFLYEFKEFLHDKYIGDLDLIEISLSKKISGIIFGEKSLKSFNEINFHIEVEYTKILSNRTDVIHSYFFSNIGTTIGSILPHIFSEVQLTRPKILVCIDEAEWLTSNQMTVFNSSMRSATDIILKIATLPYKYDTLSTGGMDDEPIQFNEDFQILDIDMDCDSQEFYILSNKIVSNKLMKCLIIQHEIRLEDAFATIGNSDYVDFYKNGFKNRAVDQETIEQLIVDQSNRDKNQILGTNKTKKSIYRKLAPLYYIRELKKLNSTGNNKAPFYCGKNSILKISDGNPRNLLQIMQILFEEGRKNQLTPIVQHEALLSYCANIYATIEWFPTHGSDLFALIKRIGETLQNKVHGPQIKDIGKSFKINKSYPLNYELIKLAIGNLLIKDKSVTRLKIASSSREFLISNALAAHFWIPMRNGDLSSVFSSSEDTQHQPRLFEGDL